MSESNMSERLRFRGPNPPFDPKDFLNPLGSSDPNIEELKKRLSGAGGEEKKIIPGPELFGAENVGFLAADAEITQRMDLVINGPKKDRARGETHRYLIDRAAHGTVDELLDVVNSAVVSYLLLIRTPQDLGVLRNVGVKPQRTRDAADNARGFISGLTHVLTTEGRSYGNPERQSLKTKAKAAITALGLFGRTNNYGSDNFRHDLIRLHIGFYIAVEDPRRSISFHHELNPNEVNEVREIAQKDHRSITQQEFDLLLRAYSCAMPLHLSQEEAYELAADGRGLSSEVLARIFGDSSEVDFIQSLRYLNAALELGNSSVKNSAIKFLGVAVSEPDSDFSSYDISNIGWLSRLQRVVGRLAEGANTINPDLQKEVEKYITNLINLPNQRFREIILLLLFDSTNQLRVLTKQLDPDSLPSAFPFDQELLDKVSAYESQNPAIDLLIRKLIEEGVDQITEDMFLELFDVRRPLGYFLDNLNANWQNLQRITREQMWPEFITEKQAKLWPSERELDILTFSRRHPAEVLGFSGIRFFTRGHMPPEVAVEFTFKQPDKPLMGWLNPNGRLVGLPFSLEERYPQIHAFLEHIAVGSFEELVTIADKRIREQGRAARQAAKSEGQTTERKGASLVSIPRREISYVRLSDHQPAELQSEEVIEKARNREHLPRLIPQKVVPLAYAQRYRYLLDSLNSAREEDRTRKLEGEVLKTLSQIPRPSGRKLENLPEQFQLIRTADGKFLETWRVEYIKPKPREGEEYNLPQIFERRFRAAPIALTKHLETWFTQPPQS